MKDRLLAAGKRPAGVVVPMVTPATPAGELDEEATRKVIDYLIAGGVAGVFVLGTTGEAASVPRAARRRLVALTVEHVAGRALVYAGIGDHALAHSIEQAESCYELGADIAVALLPSYYPLGPDEQLAYFTLLADRIPIPLMIYNIPSTTHMSIPIPVLEQLSHHRNVIGVKDSERDVARLETALAIFRGRYDFAFLVGAAPLAAAGLALGADGFVPSAGNLAPEVCQALMECAGRGDSEGARNAQRLMDDAAGLYQQRQGLHKALAAIKAMMAALGLCGPDMWPPLLPLSAAEQQDAQAGFLAWRAARQGPA